jgi:hypothetical protein
MAPPTTAARRALHHRNQFLDRTTTDPLAFIRTLDLYSTSPTSHLGLIARIKGYTTGQLDDLVAARAIVAMGAMRGSGYYVPTELIPVVNGATTRRRQTVESQALGSGLNRSAYNRLATRVGKILAGREMDATAIKKEVKPKEGDEAHVFSWVMRLMTDECRIVRTGTTGSWRSNKAVYRLWDDWLPDIDPFALGEDEACDELARIYFAAHGPATVEDFAWWSGLKKAADIVARAGIPDLGDGYHGTIAKAPTPKAVRLLPYWDGAFLTVRDRSHVIADADYGSVYDKSGNPAPVVLVDGKAQGVWSLVDEKKRLIVRAAPFDSFTAQVWTKIEAEAELIARATGAPHVEVHRRKRAPSIADGPWNFFMSPLKADERRRPTARRQP